MITKNLNKLINALNAENVVGIPTETVYGLAGNAFSKTALEKIYDLKNRPYLNPLIVHIRSIHDLPNIALEIPKIAIELGKEFWPGPLTLILKRKEVIPDLVTGGQDTVAVRVPDHALTLELLNKLSYPLAAPSANPYGRISPTTAEHVYEYFKDKVPYVLDGGPSLKGIESTILGFEGEKTILYRHGAIPIESIEKITGKIESYSSNKSTLAPGMMPKHYSPKTKMVLIDDIQNLINFFHDRKVGILLFKDEIRVRKNIFQEVLSKEGNLNEAASKLYYALHKLDKMGLDIILAEKFPPTGLGLTINDRLIRASQE